MKVNFMSLGSGSSGNCYYLWTEREGILIDAGVGIRKIKKIFRDHALSFSHIAAILVTHDHADHIKAVGNISQEMNLPVYTTREIHSGMDRSYCMTKKLTSDKRMYIHKCEPFQVGDFSIACFEVPHDATDNVGYHINIDGKVFTFITDAGNITPVMAQYISQTQYLIMEANYDERMLIEGPYPYYLKQRIMSPIGHLCNAELASYISENLPPRLAYIWMCHLSNDNNTPTLAYNTVADALKKKGVVPGEDLQLIPLKRTSPSEIYFFE